MKHETVSEINDINDKPKVDVKEEIAVEKPSKTRKKVNVKSQSRPGRKPAAKTKEKKEEDMTEMYAPIEITPTKEFWEYQKEKDGKELPRDSEHSADDDAPAKVPPKKARKEPKKSTKKQPQPTVEPVNILQMMMLLLKFLPRKPGKSPRKVQR